MRPQPGTTDEEGQKHINTQPNARKGGTNKSIMKRVLSLLLSVLMVAFLALPAAAAETTDETHKHQGNFQSWVNQYGTYHMGTCTTCGEWVNEEHTMEGDTCTVCGYMDHDHDVDYTPMNSLDGDTHDGTCKTCGTRIRAAHTYNEDGTICTVCNYEKHDHEVDSYQPRRYGDDDSCHYGTCSKCGLTIVQRHDMNGDTCKVCNYKDHDHTWQYTTNENSHRATCSECGLLVQYEPHTYGEDNICTVCGYQKHDHTFASYKTFVTPYGDYHGGTCLGCGEWVNESHTYGTDGLCTVCGYKQHTHVVASCHPEENADGPYHAGTCSVCNLSVPAYHTYGADGACTVCHYTEHTHKLINCQPAWNAGSTFHYGTCSVCNLSISADHTYGADGACTACGYKEHEHKLTNYRPIVGDSDGTYHAGTCTVCGLSIPAYHTFGENNVCTLCGYTPHKHKVDKYNPYRDGHTGRCSVCNQWIHEEHNFVNGVCEACGCMDHTHNVTYTPIVNMDGERHCGTCTECNVWLSEPHTYGEDNICTVCGYQKHDHQYAYTLVYEEDNSSLYHESLCTVCGLTVPGYHTMSNGTCTICGYQNHSHTWGESKATNDYYHAARCQECGLVSYNVHNFTDGTCSVCGFTQHGHQTTAYTRPYEEGCRGKCTECELWVVQSHTMVDGKCTVCGYQAHEHTLKYYAIGDKHYAICADCGMYTHSEYHPLTGECPICHNQEREHEHTWDNGTVTRPATYTEEGEIQYSCTGCSATKTESIAKLARYCAHACTVCGGCTLPASDASCGYTRCACAQPQAPSRTTTEATLETTVPDLTLSAEKVELQPESPYGQYITQVAAGYRVKSVFDLSLLTSGSKYDLKTGESATVTLTVGVENAKRIAAGQLFLLHVGEDGNTLYGPGGLTVTADVNNGTITFTTGSFSPFLLVENADTPAPAVLQVGQATVIKGREVTIPVTVTGNPGFAAMGFQVSYDKTRLELLECEMAPEGFELQLNKENGKAVFVGAADYIEDGTLLNLRFKVLENAEDGLAEITLTVQEALNASENEVSFSVTSGGVQVVTRVLGDVNDDGEAGSLLDILRLKKYLAGFSVEINQLNADMNENGKVDLADLILLMQQRVGIQPEG